MVAILTCDPRNLWPWSGVVVANTFTRPSCAACVAQEIPGDGGVGDTLGDNGGEYGTTTTRRAAGAQLNSVQAAPHRSVQRRQRSAAVRTRDPVHYILPWNYHHRAPPPPFTVGQQFSFSPLVFPVSFYRITLRSSHRHIPRGSDYQSNYDRYCRDLPQEFDRYDDHRDSVPARTHHKAGSRRAQESPSPCQLDRIGLFRRRTLIPDP